MSQKTDELLRDFGVSLGTDATVTVNNWTKAETGELEHTSEPIAIAAFAQVSPLFTRARFPGMTLETLVLKRPYMDYSEARAFAAVCGIQSLPAHDVAAGEFASHLITIIDRYELAPLFGRFPETAGQHGIDVRPRGKGKAEFAACRQAFAALPATRQFFAATILWLYLGGRDPLWMEKTARSWKAVDAIITLKKADALEDWARLVALYPGW
jgi:hypothetical protein